MTMDERARATFGQSLASERWAVMANELAWRGRRSRLLAFIFKEGGLSAMASDHEKQAVNYEKQSAEWIGRMPQIIRDYGDELILPTPPDCEICDQCLGTGHYDGAACNLCDGKGHFEPPISDLANDIATWIYGTYGVVNEEGEGVGTELLAETIQEVLDRKDEQ